MNNEKMLLPEGWVRVNLPDFTDIVMGQSPPSETYNNKKEGLPFFQGKAEFGKKFPIVVKYCSKPVKIARKGAILLSVRAPVGPTNMAYEKCCIGRGLCAIHPLGKITNDFVFWLFRCIESQLSSKGTGSTFSAINKQYIERLSFNLPPLNEQHRIVTKIEELFSKIDKGVESLQKAKELLVLYRQSLLKHAFEGKLTEQWRKENPDKVIPADELLEQIKQARESRYQQQLEEWESAVKLWESEGKKGKKPSKPKKLKTIIFISEEEKAKLPKIPDNYFYLGLAYAGELGRGLSKHRPRNAPKLFGGKYPFIQTGEIKAANRIISKFENTYSEIGLAQSKLWKKATLCITIAANIAQTAFLSFDACFPDSVVGFTPLEKVINADYIELFIRFMRTRIESYAPATAQKNINLSTLENLVFPFCGIDEQNQLVDILLLKLSSCDRMEQEILNSIEKSKTLKQSILKKAFSGQLVPQDPNDEPASVLLERIKAEKILGCPVET